MSNPATSDRQTALGLLARANPERLATLFPSLPTHALLRGPESGSVMVRGRQGGTGAPFNLGEMTVTRCSVRLENGTIGHAWVQGRDGGHARRAAVLDALLQTDAASEISHTVLSGLADEEAERRSTRSAKAGATRVEFFTLVRGEDQ